MLVRFSTENFLSFKESSELSLVAGRVQKLKNHVVPAETRKDLRLLKSAVIFGANASGKSNLVKAMAEAQRYIVHGLRPRASMPLNCFKLDPDCFDQATKFEFEIKAGNAYYEYSFSVDRESVVSERLKQVTKQTEELIFERARIEATKEYFFSCSGIKFRTAKDRQFLEFTEEGTPANRLFLNECKIRNVVKNLDYISPILDTYNWFEHTLNIVFPNSRYTGLEMEMQQSREIAKTFADILRRFDTGVKALQLDKVDIATGIDDMPDEIKSRLVEDLDEGENVLISSPDNTRYQFCKPEGEPPCAFKLMTSHDDSAGNTVNFDINEESDGTQRLIDIIPGLHDIFASEKVFVIDELDRSLHPMITKDIIGNFLDETADIPSQLIVTTHDSNLMDLRLLRKDELWFVQKSAQGSSEVYSLEEYNPRFDKDIRRGYLSGRFGGVPIIINEKRSKGLASGETK